MGKQVVRPIIVVYDQAQEIPVNSPEQGPRLCLDLRHYQGGKLGCHGKSLPEQLLSNVATTCG
jgi:hypothetical protein